MNAIGQDLLGRLSGALNEEVGSLAANRTTRPRSRPVDRQVEITGINVVAGGTAHLHAGPTSPGI